MDIIETSIPDVKLIKPDVFGDARGFFCELFSFERYCYAVKTMEPFVQDNWSRSQKGTLRGLHFQRKHSQGKLVTILQGVVFDVVVDLRKESPSYGQWVSVELSADSGCQLWVPPGFAHGFYVLSDVADFFYKCTDYYHPEFEITICYNDPQFAIPWPISGPPLLSQKDQTGFNMSQLDERFLPV